MKDKIKAFIWGEPVTVERLQQTVREIEDQKREVPRTILGIYWFISFIIIFIFFLSKIIFIVHYLYARWNM